jgi:hypothetical protein
VAIIGGVRSAWSDDVPDCAAVPRPTPEILSTGKAERYRQIREFGVSELDAAMKVAERIDRAWGIEPPR